MSTYHRCECGLYGVYAVRVTRSRWIFQCVTCHTDSTTGARA